MKLIVGLGNPGTEYEGTRHNAGFLAVDRLKNDIAPGESWSLDKRSNALVASGMIEGLKVMLAKPQTYMNLSGEAVQALASYYKIPLEDVLIVHDELDLPPGGLAFLAKGGHAGHNGIASIQEKLASQAVQRLRIGIGRPDGPMKTEDWVLGKMEQATHDAAKFAAEAAYDWAVEGIDQAMNEWNRK